MKVDETNIAIIRHLREGRKSFREIAEDLSLSENTVRARTNKLLEEDVMAISALIDPEALPEHRLALVGVKLNTMDLVDKGKELSRLKGVVSVAVVTGRFDLILQILLSDDYGLLEFYTEEMTKVEQVQSVETFIVYKGYNLKVPYVL